MPSAASPTPNPGVCRATWAGCRWHPLPHAPPAPPPGSLVLWTVIGGCPTPRPSLPPNSPAHTTPVPHRGRSIPLEPHTPLCAGGWVERCSGALGHFALPHTLYRRGWGDPTPAVVHASYPWSSSGRWEAGTPVVRCRFIFIVNSCGRAGREVGGGREPVDVL